MRTKPWVLLVLDLLYAGTIGGIIAAVAFWLTQNETLFYLLCGGLSLLIVGLIIFLQGANTGAE